MLREVNCMWNGVIVTAKRETSTGTWEEPPEDVIEDYTFEFGSPLVALPAALCEWIEGQSEAMEEIDAMLRAGDER